MGQTLAGFCHGLKFYRTDEQGRVFDKYGKRIYQEGEEQMVEESSEEEEVELGVEKLPENDSDDEDTPLKEIVERRWRMAKQGKGETILEQPQGLREKEEMETVTMEVMTMEMMSKKKMMKT